MVIVIKLHRQTLQRDGCKKVFS